MTLEHPAIGPCIKCRGKATLDISRNEGRFQNKTVFDIQCEECGEGILYATPQHATDAENQAALHELINRWNSEGLRNQTHTS